MGDSKDEIRLQRLTKEEREILKEKNRIKKEKQKELDKRVRGKVKLSAEDKNKIKKLNILQIMFLIGAVLIEVLSIYNMVPQVVSIIGLVVLSASCIYTLRKINKIMNKNEAVK
jgi:Mg2+/citrate symporter